jgi:4-hydroxy-tetrahydrodipicolinate synthase
VRLAEHPRISAVKDAKGDLYASAWVMARTDLAYYSGDDAINLAHLANGAVGVVSVVGHVAGEQHASLVEADGVGDLETREVRQPAPAAGGARHHDPRAGSRHGQGRP